MDAVEAIATRLEAAVTGDTGAGGLRNATGNQYLLGSIERSGDARKTEATNFIEYTVVPVERGYEQERREVEALVRCAIVTDRSRGFASVNAIEDRLIVLLTTTDFVATGGWNFSRVKTVRPAFLVEQQTHRLRHVVETHWTVNK
jgi:hypothetical protein